MPPTKSLPKPKDPKQPATKDAPSSADVLVLFAKNLEEMKRWYRSANTAGQGMGHVVMNEIILTNVSHALELALKGEAWSQPAHNP